MFNLLISFLCISKDFNRLNKTVGLLIYFKIQNDKIVCFTLKHIKLWN